MPDRYNNIAPGDKTRVHTRPLFPILFANPYPDSNPNALIGGEVYFYKAGDWFVDNKDDIYFINPFNNDTTYFTKIDTQNQYHLMRGQVIITDLLDEVSYLPVSKGSTDSARYWPTGIDFIVRDNQNIGASAPFDTGILSINTNRKNGILLPNIYIIKSIFRHEMLHIRERPLVFNEKTNKIKYEFIDHANVYEEQMTYPEFLEAPEYFQINMIKEYIWRLFNEYCKKDVIDTIRFQETLDKFNESTGKLIEANLQLRKNPNNIQVNGSIYEVTVSYKNIMREPVRYKFIQNAVN